MNGQCPCQHGHCDHSEGRQWSVSGKQGLQFITIVQAFLKDPISSMSRVLVDMYAHATFDVLVLANQLSNLRYDRCHLELHFIGGRSWQSSLTKRELKEVPFVLVSVFILNIWLVRMSCVMCSNKRGIYAPECKPMLRCEQLLFEDPCKAAVPTMHRRSHYRKARSENDPWMNNH